VPAPIPSQAQYVYPAVTFTIENALAPAPSQEVVDALKQQFANMTDANEFRSVDFSENYFGVCGGASTVVNCAQYTYAAFYALFEHYTGKAPTIWDILSAVYFNELGLYAYDSPRSNAAVQALARSFFFVGPRDGGGCRYSSSANQFDCSYVNMIEWLSATAWNQHTCNPLVNPTGCTLSTNLTYTNLLRTLGFNDTSEVSNTFGNAINSGSQFDTISFHNGIVNNVGMFAYDAHVQQISQNIATWRDGPGQDIPSKWGNRIITSGTQSYPETTDPWRRYPIIQHNYQSFVDNVTGRQRSPTTLDANNKYGDDQGETGYPGTLDPICTTVTVIVDVDGGFAANELGNCPR
jgi:hypothetical protein